MLSRRHAFFTAAFALIVAFAGMAPVFAASRAGAATQTVVSLEFDDGTSNQYQTRAMFTAHNMDATYFINSGQVGVGNYLTWTQLHDLASDGNEIGGHTIDHPDLTTLSTDQATHEVCDDRAALMAQGFAIRSFAYPYGRNTTTTQNIVRGCGYNSARDVSGIRSPEGCGTCPYAETIPPLNAYDTRTPENVVNTMAVSEIEGFVTQAEQHGGGWVQIVMHNVCTPSQNCGTYTISPTDLTTFLDWLQPRSANGTVVRTVGDVIGGPVQPPPNQPPPVTTVQNPSLETYSPGALLPDCWQIGASGTNTAAWSRVTDAHTGKYAEKVVISAYTSGDRKIVQRQDQGACAPAISAGHSYTLTEWYKGSSNAFTIFTRDASGTWIFCQQTAPFPPSFVWTQASFTWTQPTTSNNGCGSSTGYVPTAISFGLALARVGSLTVDDAAIVAAS